LSLQQRLNSSVYATPRFSTARADWNTFDGSLISAYANLQREINVVADAEGLDSFVLSFNTKVTEACDASMHRVKEFSRPPVHWWSTALADKRREVNRARKRLVHNHQNHRTNTLYDSHIRLRREYRNSIKVSRQESWKRFCSEQGTSAWGPLYNFISRTSPQGTGPTTVRNINTHQMTSTPTETAEYLLTIFS
jgi:hypothetical protein